MLLLRVAKKERVLTPNFGFGDRVSEVSQTQSNTDDSNTVIDDGE
jgi:hypothetical protein